MSVTALRRRCVVGGLGIGVGLLAAAGAWALPPGGAVDDPGDPPATITIVTPSVPVNGAVSFTGTGWLNQDGTGQSVMVKFDDFGNNGIGPFTADAQGNLSGTVSLTPPANATARQRADYAPSDMNQANSSHWLRFLTGPWGSLPRNGPPRSMRGTFASSPPRAQRPIRHRLPPLLRAIPPPPPPSRCPPRLLRSGPS